ncbi:MAG: M28 family peptidase [bacterium]|nr:M28 family peptidase [bacterium]
MAAKRSKRVFAWLVALSLVEGCGASEVDPSEIPTTRAFDSERAFADLKALVNIGPRHSGSEGAERARALIASSLRQAGWRVEEQGFSAGLPGRAPIQMKNIVGTREGTRDRHIWIITHYDTKDIPGMRFVGANDGGSGVALLLEFARVFSAIRLEYGVSLVFFDGEEALGRSINQNDGLYGSRWLAREMEQKNQIASIAGLILVDMVADKQLNLAVDMSSSPRLRRIMVQAARKIGDPELIDPAQTLALIDDHTPFQERGVSNSLGIIDFEFGAGHSPGPLWHTRGDDLSAVSADSLNRVGRLLVELFRGIERDLQSKERANAP